MQNTDVSRETSTRRGLAQPRVPSSTEAVFCALEVPRETLSLVVE